MPRNATNESVDGEKSEGDTKKYAPIELEKIIPIVMPNDP